MINNQSAPGGDQISTTAVNDSDVSGDLGEDITPDVLSDASESVQPATATNHRVLKSFEAAELNQELLAAIKSAGWEKPTEIQSICLAHTLAGRDVAGFAQTGTGKTGVFLITVANKILQAKAEGTPLAQPSCVILTPTRELTMQVEQDAADIFGPVDLTTTPVFGGVDYEKQAKILRGGVDIIVATPGRLKDYVQKRVVALDKVEIFVCDEADRMFDMGFIEDVEFFLNKVPEDAQKLLFSATTNDKVKELAFEYLNKPEYIFATPESITPDKITQHAIICEAKDKLKVMLGLIADHQPTCSIIFTNTKIAAEWLHYKLTNNGFHTDLITGDLPQRKRIALIRRIKEGKVKALIATDVASRGLHISDVTHVYNFDLPDDPSNYVHRIGRTARAGATGAAVSLVCEDYGDNLKAINELLGEELALQSEWFDEKYLAIEDRAGDPFKDANSRLGRALSKNSSGSRGSDRNRDDKPRKTTRAPRKSGISNEEASQERQSPGRTQKGKRQDRQGGQRNQGKNNNRGGSKRRRGFSQRDGGRSKGRSGQPHRQNRNDQSSQHPAVAAAPKDQSIGSIMKKFIRTIFGRK